MSLRLLWTVALLATTLTSVLGQYPGWQQAVSYDMEVTLDSASHQYQGVAEVTYKNNSPETLDKVFWHLFFNAFQPGSMMDVRSRTIEDPDRRVGSRIVELPEEEWGWIHMERVKAFGQDADFDEDGTILVVDLPKALRPGKSVTFELAWTAQVPRQIRRSGWMNKEGVEYSMTQWYPRLCEFDHHGWHSNPYIGREFHGIWGDFEVTLDVPSGYVVAGTGVKTSEKTLEGPQGTHRTQSTFEADDVIDFAWAADPDFIVESVVVGDVDLNLVHQANPDIDSNWTALAGYAAKAMAFINEDIGPYAYPQYTVAQGGDGGMEYPMITLVTGERSLRSLVGVTVHEMAHSWFQAMVATNESLHEWMDEGFTSWAESRCMAHLFADPMKPSEDPHGWAYASYIRQHLSGNEEPLITHADHYKTNRAYGVGAYSKGEVLVEQLGAIVGPEVRDAAMRRYFKEWSFKHPGPHDFKRVVERESGLELDWYFQDMMHTTNAVDYQVSGVQVQNDSAVIQLARLGDMAMPQDLTLTWDDETTTSVHIPLVMMRGHRALRDGEILGGDWPWVDPNYELTLPTAGKRLKSVELNASGLVADVHPENDEISFNLDLIQEAMQSH
ncbi:MAG TPA: peptidase M1 [Flavobacteriales bacterium]|nr:peptidase M1 [Flavobacteriales bacterium]